MVSDDEVCSVVYEMMSEIFLFFVGFDVVFSSSMEGKDFEIAVLLLHFLEVRGDELFVEGISR